MNKSSLKSIWEAPIYLPYLQPTLTDEMVKEAENLIGFRLPYEYVNLLKIQNGGYIRYTLKNTPHSVIAGIGLNYPSITDFEWFRSYDDYMSFSLEGLFPFDGDGHWNLCLDYRKNNLEPEITYIDTESDFEELIASNFSCYLNMLEIEVEDEYIIQLALSIEYTITQISNITNIKFEEPDYFAHGYAVYRGMFNGSWVWVSPNKVPRGFIRETEDRYEELKTQMEGTALRFPEVPENSVIINISDETQGAQLINKLIENGLSINKLKDLI
ncbi:SMI1/KNR4 family protein [Mucilaginibacter ginsenosidivorax]|uniref:SMI1/KNR4 family protein n=1 Tax=Mucilaginibacter ginsenosidivorax TaxID=862126 RepID=A0A5B8VYH1_9SPHI|nr:SMI1/KNR4 family protein [Mucilaginibacter ginsenosidivorax]QEC75685.1 SMI1/KNR4 family protein [Mucilaginibacter ginsenosidivorax]